MPDNEVKISITEGASSGGSTGGSGAGSPTPIPPSGGGGGLGRGRRSGGTGDDDIGPKIPEELKSILNSLGLGNVSSHINSLMQVFGPKPIQNIIPVANVQQATVRQAAGVPNVLPAGQGGGGMGAAAGSLAQLGLVGAGIAAGMYVVDQAKKKIIDVVDTVGEFGKAIGGLNTHGFIEGINKVMEKLGPMGEIAAHVSRAFFGVVQAVNETANKLSAYNGQLAAATAQANVAQIQGDIRRAQLLGPNLSRFVEAQSKFEQAGQDALAIALNKILPLLTKGLEALVGSFRILESLSDIRTWPNVIIDALNGLINIINEANITFLPHLKNIDRIASSWERAQKDDKGFIEGFWADLFNTDNWDDRLDHPARPGPRPTPPRPQPLGVP